MSCLAVLDVKKTSVGRERGLICLVHETDIKVICCGMGTAHGWNRGSVICGDHVSLELLKPVGFGGRFITEVWIEINCCVQMGLIVLKVPGDNVEKGGNCMQKEFSRVSHGNLIGGSCILGFLIRFL